MKTEEVAKLVPVERLQYWIKERESIRLKKEAGQPRPWTDDQILNTYRFCNVHREDDRVTKWIAENWREPLKNEEHLWFAMCVARLFNLPATLDFIGFPIPVWEPDKVRGRLEIRKESGNNLFNGAYIVSTNGKKMDKVQYVLTMVLAPLWRDRERIAPKEGMLLNTFHRRLMEYDGMGSFMSAQVAADLKYVEPLFSAPDWLTFAASGPGSRRGLNRLMGREVNHSWKEIHWRSNLEAYRTILTSKTHMQLHGQDFQNCLCEFDKYCRTLEGQGKPKQKYRPAD